MVKVAINQIQVILFITCHIMLYGVDNLVDHHGPQFENIDLYLY
jgi:hypothetical protein